MRFVNPGICLRRFGFGSFDITKVGSQCNVMYGVRCRRSNNNTPAWIKNS
jgi:hypothetical protein